MPYVYEIEKPSIFTESGQEMFLKIRDQIKAKIKIAGVVRMQEAISGCTGDMWKMMACVDRMVELKEITEIKSTSRIPGQFRIFMSADDLR